MKHDSFDTRTESISRTRFSIAIVAAACLTASGSALALNRNPLGPPAATFQTDGLTAAPAADPQELAEPENLVIDVRSDDTRKSDSSAFIWKGFGHEWRRTIGDTDIVRYIIAFIGGDPGFTVLSPLLSVVAQNTRVPHRVSRLTSVIGNEDLRHDADNEWYSEARFTFGQGPGVDGDYMKPVGHYSAFAAAGIHVTRGHVYARWTDVKKGEAHPRAKSVIDRYIDIAELDTAELGYGALDNYGAFLRGVDIQICKHDEDGVDGACERKGIWPYKMHFDLSDCNPVAGRLRCRVLMHLFRAWTPYEGGGKKMAKHRDIRVKLNFTVVGGNNGDFAFTQGNQHVRRGTIRDGAPTIEEGHIDGTPLVYPSAAAAITGFGFELGLPDPDQLSVVHQALADVRHLGRYLGKLRFELSDLNHELDYYPPTGRFDYRRYSQVWAPEPVPNAEVKYFTRTALLQFGDSDVSVSERQSVRGSLCVESQDNATPFPWHRCGEPDTGPERAEDEVLINGGHWPGHCICDDAAIVMACVFPGDNDACDSACRAGSHYGGACNPGM